MAFVQGHVVTCGDASARFRRVEGQQARIRTVKLGVPVPKRAPVAFAYAVVPTNHEDLAPSLRPETQPTELVRFSQPLQEQAKAKAPIYSPPPLVMDLAEVPCEEEKGGLLWPFLLPSSSSVSGNAFLLLSYGYLLFTAAGLISEGSELLLEILNPGIVGGLLLPVLGALPDSLIIIASGMRGTVEEAQQEVSVGLGVLAGSTVVLLTLAWSASLAAGACDIEEDGKAKDQTLTRGFDLQNTGVTTDDQTRLGAKIMIASCLPYLAVQVPLIDGHPAEGPEAAVIGAALCFAGFAAYSIYQVTSPWLQEKRMMQARKRLLRARVVRSYGRNDLNFGGLLSPSGELNQAALDNTFDAFDRDKNGSLDLKELEAFLIGVQMDVRGALATKDEANLWLEEFDTEKNGVVSRKEFTEGMATWTDNIRKEIILSADLDLKAAIEGEISKATTLLERISADEAFVEEEEEEEDEEELSPGLIARKAGLLLALGSAIVATFADPAVATIGNFSKALDADPFLVAFVITPLASNASEVVSSYLFACKKRKSNISLCYSQVYGAITMNNTLCLGIFLAIVHLRGLTWDFSAEVTAMVTVITIMGLIGSSRNTFRLYWALPAAILYPVCLGGVEYLEQSLGWH